MTIGRSLRHCIRTVAAAVHNPPADQDEQVIEQLEAVGSGRVDGRSNGHPRRGQTPKDFQDLHVHVGS